MSPITRPLSSSGDSLYSAPLISIVIPNYNYGRYLGKAIESVLGQSYRNREIIVVDDGSTDESASVLRHYGDQVRWFQQRHRGVSAARNHGIRESRGELVAFLDADDTWRLDKLERQVPLLRHPAVGMVYTGLQYVNEAGQRLGVNLSGRCGRVLQEIALLEGPGVPATGSSALIRRDCLEKVGLFDEELSTSADWDLWRRIACHYEIEVVGEPLVFYRLHSSAMHRRVELMERDILRAFAKMFTDPAAAEVRPLRRRCYGNLHMMLCGSYLRARRWDKSLVNMVRSLRIRPAGLFYMAAFPVRNLRRHLGMGGANIESAL